MIGNTPSEAYKRFQDDLNEALSCVTAGRLTIPRGPRLVSDLEYSIVLNHGRPVDLSGEHRLRFRALQNFTIMETEASERGRYRVRTTEYVYQIATRDEEELLAYHWTPEKPVGFRLYPHLHIGLVSIAKDAPIPEFHKLHLPTSRVSLESIVRLLIDDFGVQPRRSNWRDILDSTEAAFLR
jgi:hypothetical protein